MKKLIVVLIFLIATTSCSSISNDKQKVNEETVKDQFVENDIKDPIKTKESNKEIQSIEINVQKDSRDSEKSDQLDIEKTQEESGKNPSSDDNKISGQKNEDLSFIDCYRDIITSKIPYLISDSDGVHYESYLNDDTYIDGKYYKATYQHGARYFNIIEHKDFAYPLLVLKERNDIIHAFSIIQYQGNGEYITFESLGNYESSILPENLFFDSKGNLYADSLKSHDIFAINKVDDKLLTNYTYTPEAKGYATRVFGNYEVDPPELWIDEENPKGIDLLCDLMINEDTKEDFSKEELDELKKDLKPIEFYDLSEEKFNELAKEKFYKDKNLATDVIEEDEKVEKSDEYSKLRNYIKNNFTIDQPEGEQERIFIADYDNNGVLCAFFVAMNEDYKPELMFINEDYEVKMVKKLSHGTPYKDGTGYNKILNGGVFTAGDYEYISIEENNGGSGVFGSVYSVKENDVYEPYIPDRVAIFTKQGDYFENKYYYHEYTENGGVLKEGIEYYYHDNDSRQFYRLNEKPKVVDSESQEDETTEEKQAQEDQSAEDEKEIIENKASDQQDEKSEILEKPDNVEENTQETKKEDNTKNNNKEQANEWQIENLKNLKPQLNFTSNLVKAWSDVRFVQFYIKNFTDYPKETKIVIECDDLNVDKLDGYTIYDFEADSNRSIPPNKIIIETKKLKTFFGLKEKKSINKALKLTYYLTDGVNRSEEYTYYYNPVLEEFLYDYKNDYIYYTGEIVNNLEVIRDKKVNVGFEEYINKDSPQISYLDNKIEKELAEKWFSCANKMHFEYLKEELESSKNKDNSGLNILNNNNPKLDDIIIAKNIINKLKTGEIEYDYTASNKNKYELVFNQLGIFGAIQYDGYIKDKNTGKTLPNLSNMLASPKITENQMKFIENDLRVTCLKAIDKFFSSKDYQSFCSGMENIIGDVLSKDRNVNFKTLASVYSSLSKSLKENGIVDRKQEVEVSDILGLYQNGVDLFSASRALQNIIKSNPEDIEIIMNINKKTKGSSDFKFNKKTDSLIDDAIIVYKYLGRLD